MPSHSTSAPQPDVQQTGEPPPPAPRVMPVHLPQKAKSQRSHRETRPSIAQGAQSGSDTERVTTKVIHIRSPDYLLVLISEPSTVWNALLLVLLCKEATRIHLLPRGIEAITIRR